MIPNEWIGTDGLYKIKPAHAAEMLKLNAGNRPVDKRKVSTYAALMKAGKWKDNGQTISFDPDLRLMNGQHRLLACIEAGAPFETRVAWGVDPTSFDTIDVGRRRSVGQVLGLAGEINTNDLGTLLRMILRDERGCADPTLKDDAEACELIEVLGRHPEARTSIERIAKDKALRSILTTSTSSYLHWRVHRSRPAELEAFFRSLADGVDLARNSPVRMLREKMIGLARTSGMRVSRSMQLAFAIKAWNAFLLGKPMQLLRWTDAEPFPTITGASKSRKA